MPYWWRFVQGGGGSSLTNLIKNSTFDNSDYWVLAGMWAISGGKLVGNGAFDFAYCSYDDNNTGSPTNTIESGKSYRVTLDVVRNSGSLELRYNTTLIGDIIVATDSYSFDFTNVSAVNSVFRFFNGNSFDGTIDNVKLYEL